MGIQRVNGSTFNSQDNLTIDTFADLATLPDTAKEGCLIILGHTAVGDNGGGTFVYSSTTARNLHNNGTIIDDTGTGIGTGCWVRLYSLAEGSLAWFGSADNSRSNLTQARGVEGLQVTIVDGIYSGRFQFQGAEVGNHDGINNFNGWVRVNDVNFTNNINLHSNRIINSDTAVDPTDVPNLVQVEGLITDITTLEAYPVTLSSGQQSYTYPNDVNLTNGFVFINGPLGQGVDRGRLKQGVDYNISGQTLTLEESYPSGTIITVNWYSGNAIPVSPGIVTKTIATSTYTISNSDIDYTLKFTYDDGFGVGCVVTLPGTGVWPQFSCLIHNTGGDLTFSGGNLPVELSGWTTVMTDGWAALLGDVAEGDFNLTGDTKP